MTQKEAHQKIKPVLWNEVYDRCGKIAKWILESVGDNTVIYGIPRGGLAPAVTVVHHIEALDGNARFVASLDHLLPGEWNKLVIVDEICDSGGTLAAVSRRFPEARTAVLFARGALDVKPDYSTCEIWDDRWLQFPWEADSEV